MYNIQLFLLYTKKILKLRTIWLKKLQNINLQVGIGKILSLVETVIKVQYFQIFFLCRIWF